MNLNIKKLTGLTMAALISISSLTGCTSQDKQSVNDCATTFLAIVASDSEEDISKYATSEVAAGDFVQLFDAEYLSGKFISDTENIELTEESKNKLDEFCGLFSDMIQDYSVSDVEITKGETTTATCTATVKTSFAVDVISSDKVADEIEKAKNSYATDHAEEIQTLSDEDAAAANNKVYNDMLMLILQIYEDEIANSQEMTYAMVLTLEKNTETDSWIVTNVESYDDSNGN